MQATDIDDVLVKLTGIIDRYRDKPLAFFPAVYRATTARVKAGIQGGKFADGARMGRLVTTFANRYLAAFDGKTQVGTSARPRAWRVAFDAVERPHIMILQHVLVGMNAHINLDLPLAVVEAANGGDITALKPDFEAINDILEKLLDPVQAVIGGFSPLLNILDKVGGRGDERLLTFSIKVARAEAWHEATRLARESVAQRELSGVTLDRRVGFLASRIIVPEGALGMATALIARTENPDVASITAAMLAIV